MDGRRGADFVAAPPCPASSGIVSLPENLFAAIVAANGNCERVMRLREVSTLFKHKIEDNIRLIYGILRRRRPYKIVIWPQSEADDAAERAYDAQHGLQIAGMAPFDRFVNACKLKYDLRYENVLIGQVHYNLYHGPISMDRVPERRTDLHSYTRAVYWALLIANAGQELYNPRYPYPTDPMLDMYIFYLKHGITPEVAYYYSSGWGIREFTTYQTRDGLGREPARSAPADRILGEMLYTLEYVPLSAVRAVDAALLKSELRKGGDFTPGYGDLKGRIQMIHVIVRLGPEYYARYMEQDTATLDHPADTLGTSWPQVFGMGPALHVRPWELDTNEDRNRYRPEYTPEAILAEARKFEAR
jgi:hypothetical protein